MKFFFSGKYKDAVEIFTKIVEANPNLIAAHYYLAIIYRLQGKTHEAITHIGSFIKINPSIDWLFLEFGFTYLMIKRFAEAIQCFSKVRGIDPVHWSRLGTPEY